MSGLRFSANLAYLWADLPLADGIRAAHRAGFAAVEIQWPEAADLAAAERALQDTGLPMLGVNNTKGDLAAGEFGHAALPGRSDEARAAVEAALDLAARFGAGYVHVLAGIAGGAEARAAYVDALTHAASRAAEAGRVIVIEAINPHDVPGYFMADLAEAVAILREVGAPNLKLMFDCYHASRLGHDVQERLGALLPLIHHVQIAGVPERGPPDRGSLDYRAVFATLQRLEWPGYVGAEYKPGPSTEGSLGWMQVLAPG
ncbi:MAG: TIM barrel protein [Pseudomonadota bacterium]